MKRHLTLLFNQHYLQPIEDARLHWDPNMAAFVPAHLTLAYQEEFGVDYELLLKRAGVVAGNFNRFWVTLLGVMSKNEGRDGVFLEVSDPTDSWNELRETLLKEPFSKVDVAPHITIVHPRTSDQGPEAWLALRNWKPRVKLEVREICFTETSDQGLRVIESFPLKK